jgi:putative membrane protein
MHEAHGIAPTGLLLLAGLCGYAGLVLLPRRRRPWPGWRTASWFAGLGTAGLATLGPPARDGFVAHSAGHVLLGMVAPLLACCAAPLTLLLRALPVRAARPVSRVLRSRPAAAVSHPVTALLLAGGGLWLLYATPLYGFAVSDPAVQIVVHAHVFAAGYLLTAALAGPDPAPHRAAPPLRAAVLVAYLAAHGILAKFLYAHPPAGVPPDQAHTGAMLMYYGGDAVDLVLIVLMCRQWLGPIAGQALVPAASPDSIPGTPAPRA